MGPSLDAVSWRAVAGLMEPGEAPVWTARPDPARMALAGAGRSVIGIVLLAVWWRLLGPHFGSADMLTLAASALFGAIGLWALLGPVFAYRRATRTCYAATGRRVLRVSGKTLEWVSIAGLREPQVRLRGGGTGDVVLRTSFAALARQPGETRPEFRGRRLSLRLSAVPNPEELRQYLSGAIQREREAAASPPASAGADSKSRPTLSIPIGTAVIVALCVASMFFDVLGYPLGLAGLFLLWKRRALRLPYRLALTAMVLVPRVAVLWLGARAGPDAYQIETRTFATSSSVWAWSLLVLGLGIACLLLANSLRRGAASERKWPASAICGLIGLVAIGASALIFLGLDDDFQAIQPGEGGEWRLTHPARGTVAAFHPADVQLISGERRRRASSGRRFSYEIRVRLRDGREWAMTTGSPLGPEEKLKKLAGTLDLPPGAVRLNFAPERAWVNSGRKYRPEDWAGAYRAATGESVLEFRVIEGRLAGTEILQLGGEKIPRELRIVQFTPEGDIEFTAETVARAAKQGEQRYSLSFSYAPHRRAVLREGLVEVDGARYDRIAAAAE